MPFNQDSSASGTGAVLFDSTLAAPAVSIDTGANGIAGGHINLVILIYCRSDRAANTSDNVAVRFNADSGANYVLEQLLATNVTASASNNLAIAEAIGTVPAATAASNVFGFVRCEVYNYDNTANFKQVTIMSSNAQTTAAASSMEVDATMWKNTAAITRVSVSPVAGTNLVTGSRMTIYGSS